MSSNTNNVNIDWNLVNQLAGVNAPQTARTMWDTMTPEERLVQPTLDDVQSKMVGDQGTLWKNFQANTQRIGTGLTDIWNEVTSGELFPKVLNYMGSTPLSQKAEDYVNMVLSPYKVEVDDFGKRSAADIALGAVQGAWENPLDFTIDAISMGALKPLGHVGDVVNKATGRRILPSKLGDNIEKAIAGEVQPVKAEISGLYGEIKSIKKNDLDKLIKSAEEGTPVPAGMEEGFAKLKHFSDKYDELAAKYSPATHVPSDELVAYQRYARKNNITYEQARKELSPIIDRVKSGEYNLSENINKNKKAAFLYETENLYKEGKIFPVTHGLAEVDKALGSAAKTLGGDNFVKAGRFSTRAYGNATYENIAKELTRPDTFLENLTKQYVDTAIAKKILEGKLGSVDLVGDTSKNTVYLSSQDLLAGNLKKAIKEAKKEALTVEDIPVNKLVFEELKHQIGDSTSAFSGALKDSYTVGKGQMLAQGTYIGANAITGATNALMNSNVYIVNDIINAIKSKGDLAKKLGVYRYDTKTKVNTPLLKQAHSLNRMTGSEILKKLDGALQNTFAEIAGHAELRRRGISYSKNADKLQDINKMKLGEIISDVKDVALLNRDNTILPKDALSVLSATNPFWRWQDTAARSTVRMLEKSPILANTVLVDVLANIGFDNEMQERLKLGVSLDEPYVSYRFNDKTGEIRKTTSEFVPMTTTLKLLAPSKGTSFSPSVPFLTAMINASQGKDKYGNIMKRPIKPNDNSIISSAMGKRFEFSPEYGYREIGGMGDEILATAIKELLGGVTLYNRTIAPLGAMAVGKMTGQDLHYNQPYAQSIFGDFTDTDQYNTFISGGDMDKQRTGEQVLRSLAGLYDQRYIPKYEERLLPISKRGMRDFWRGVSSRELRR